MTLSERCGIPTLSSMMLVLTACGVTSKNTTWGAILFMSVVSLYCTSIVSKFNLPPPESKAFLQEEAFQLRMEEKRQSTSTTSLALSLDRNTFTKVLPVISVSSGDSPESMFQSSMTNKQAMATFPTPVYETNLNNLRHYGDGRSHYNSTSSCHFEDGHGYYKKINETLSWEWVHDTSLSVGNSKNCTIKNQIDALLHNQYNVSKPLVILTLGDSLDRNTITRWICGSAGNAEKNGFRLMSQRKKEPSLPPEFASLVNVAKVGKFSSGICTNDRIAFAVFRIFGMHHDCDNEEYMYQEESRKFNTTAERVDKLLDFEILSRVPKASNFVVMVGSALWDLSRGDACNNHVGVSEQYAALYRKGILDLHATIRKFLPDAPIYWKTSPAVSVEYDNLTTTSGFGRNRANQNSLNTIMRQTVSQYQLGVVVDWWNQANQRPEMYRGIMEDGRHYRANPSIAFYNMFLNAVFDHHPELIHSQN